MNETSTAKQMSGETILLVDSDEAVLDGLSVSMSRYGYNVHMLDRGEDVASYCVRENPSLVVLETDLPDISGFEVCRRLQADKQASRIPLVFYTKSDDEMDLVVGFQLGAYDYVSKKASTRELCLRIIAILRRCRPNKFKKRISVGEVIVDFEQSIAIKKGRRLSLSPNEFQILAALTMEEGRVMRRQEIIAMVWRGDDCVMKRTVDAYIKTLRAKLADAGVHIVTIRGLGYSLRVEKRTEGERSSTEL